MASADYRADFEGKRKRVRSPHEQPHQVRVQMAGGCRALGEDQRIGMRVTTPIRSVLTVLNQEVRDGDEAGEHGDSVSGETTRLAGPVHSFVMVASDRRNRLEGRANE